MGAYLVSSPFAVVVTSPESWVEVRTADRIAVHLAELSIPLVAPRSVTGQTEHLQSVRVRVLLEDEEVRERTPIRVEATIGPDHVFRKGRADQLDETAVAVAAALAAALGRYHEGVENLIQKQPWPLHRLLGKARSLELQGRWLQARLMFERAARLGDEVWVEAAAGRARCSSLASRSRYEELARAAATQARVAERNGDIAGARAAWISYLKFTPQRGRAAELWIPTDDLRFVGATAEAVYASTPNAVTRLAWDPMPGVEQGDGHLRAVGPGFLMIEDEVGLGRRDELSASPRWRADGVNGQVVVEGGQVGIFGPQEIRWLDPAQGRNRSTARFSQIIAVGSRGAFVREEEALALVRPGQSVPAWIRRGPHRPRGGAVTEERVLALIADSLRIMRSRDGETVAELEVEPSLELMHADGRFAVLGHDRIVVVVDILKGREVRRLIGPGRLVGADGRSSGVLLAFASGDLFLLNDEGQVAWRERILVQLSDVFSSPLHPGLLLAISAAGIHVLVDPGREQATFGTAVLELGRLALLDDEPTEALRLFEWGARSAFGLAAASERLRRELLPDGPAKQYAEERISSAEQLAVPLLPYARLGTGTAKARSEPAASDAPVDP